MSEPGTEGRQAADDEGSHASVGDGPSRAGAGRTAPEAAVDEDLGSGDQPTG